MTKLLQEASTKVRELPEADRMRPPEFSRRSFLRRAGRYDSRMGPVRQSGKGAIKWEGGVRE